MTVTSPTSAHVRSSASSPLEGLRSALGALVRTDGDVSPLLVRVTLGLVLFPHGAQKLLGWFGGYGF